MARKLIGDTDYELSWRGESILLSPGDIVPVPDHIYLIFPTVKCDAEGNEISPKGDDEKSESKTSDESAKSAKSAKSA
jgi:hypothetical protein